MPKKYKNTIGETIGSLFLIIISFVLIGTGLTILYSSNGDFLSVIGGFALIGIAIAIIYNRIIQNGK